MPSASVYSSSALREFITRQTRCNSSQTFGKKLLTVSLRNAGLAKHQESMRRKMRFSKKNLLIGITLAISIGFNFRNSFNTQTTRIAGSSINKRNEFVYDGRKYENVIINNYTMSSKGEIAVTLSAIDQATGDLVKFTSPPTVVAKWGKAIWGKDKWN